MRKGICILWLLVGLVFWACVRESVVPSGESSYPEEAGVPEVLAVIDSVCFNHATVRVTLKSAGERKIEQVKCYYSLDSLMRPEYRDSILIEWQGNPVFIVRIPALIPNTKYYCQVVAKNTRFEGHSGKFEFITQDNSCPEIRFYPALRFQPYDYVLFDATITTPEVDTVGLIYGKDPYVRPNASYSEKKWDSCSRYEFTLYDFELNATYYCRYFLKIGDEVYYSSVKSVKTMPAALAEISTSPVTNVSDSSVKTGYMLLARSSTPIKRLGFCVGTSLHPTVGKDRVIEQVITDYNQVNVSGLELGTIYYLRSFVENASGVAYGEEYRFTTKRPGEKVNEPWKKVACLPESVPDGAMVIKVEDHLFVASYLNNRLWRYNLSESSWKECSPIPGSRDLFAWTAIDGFLYCSFSPRAGAFGLARYDTGRDEWTCLVDSVYSYLLRGGWVCGDKLYYNLNSDSHIFEYDMRTGEYDVKEVWAVFPWCYNVFSFDGGMYLGKEKNIYKFSFAEMTWKKHFDVPYTIRLAYFFQRDEFLYSIGGVWAYETSEVRGLPISLRYDVRRALWQRRADCPTEDAFHVDMSVGDDAMVGDAFVVCDTFIWQYFPEEDVDSELINEL